MEIILLENILNLEISEIKYPLKTVMEEIFY